jgi:glycosyltransferase involved in cell wall biosynthesis
MPDYQLSIIVPAFNEEKTIAPLLEKIMTTDIKSISLQVILVDDGSGDGTGREILTYINAHPWDNIQYLKHEKNSGKGSAIHTGIRAATGDFILIQDADLEYDTADYNSLLQPILEDKADVVYGSRFAGGRPHRILFFWHSIGNKLLTFFSNMFSNLNLSDMENGFKLFRAEILKPIALKEKRFGFEPEVTAKIAKIPGIRIYEVGIAYYGRTYKEGKKIHWRDGIKAIYCVFRYNLFDNKKDSAAFKINPAITATLLFFLAGILLIFFAEGTADEGDSVMHYLYAKHAFLYPEYFFYQWAKPLYVLITAPVAQLGFNAIKFFNLLVSAITLWLTFKTAKKLNIADAWMTPVIAACAPMLTIVSLSGLTEPLFALWLIAGIYWLIDEKKTGSIISLSFLPFVRSEGLIVLCVVLLYLLFKKLFRYIPLLMTGHIVYAIAGYSIYKDPLWVFNKLSYATLSSAYGHGEWIHFVKHMPEIVGYPIYYLLIAGLVFGCFLFAGKYLFRDKEVVTNKELFLVYGCFAAVFIGHTAFWALGIFNSFGLLRVMIGVLPLIALISLRGLNAVSDILKLRILKYFLLGWIIIFPFAGNTYSFHWKRDFSLKADQKAELRMADYIKKNFPDYKNYVFYFEACWNSVVLDINYFDETKHKRFLGSFEKNEFPDKCFLVWDDWFARVEGQVELHQLLGDNRFELLQTFEEKDYWGVTRTVKLFRKK